MKRTWMFFKLDLRRCRSTIPVFLMFALFSAAYRIMFGSERAISSWMIFFSSILYFMPFQSLKDEHFYKTLPGTDKERVLGRYLYLFVVLAYMFLVYGMTCMIRSPRHDGQILIIYCLLMLGFSMASVINIFLYQFRYMVRKRTGTVIRVLPGVLLGFLASCLLDDAKYRQAVLRVLQAGPKAAILTASILALAVWAACWKISSDIYGRTDL